MTDDLLKLLAILFFIFILCHKPVEGYYSVDLTSFRESGRDSDTLVIQQQGPLGYPCQAPDDDTYDLSGVASGTPGGTDGAEITYNRDEFNVPFAPITCSDDYYPAGAAAATGVTACPEQGTSWTIQGDGCLPKCRSRVGRGMRRDGSDDYYLDMSDGTGVQWLNDAAANNPDPYGGGLLENELSPNSFNVTNSGSCDGPVFADSEGQPTSNRAGSESFNSCEGVDAEYVEPGPDTWSKGDYTGSGCFPACDEDNNQECVYLSYDRNRGSAATDYFDLHDIPLGSVSAAADRGDGYTGDQEGDNYARLNTGGSGEAQVVFDSYKNILKRMFGHSLEECEGTRSYKWSNGQPFYNATALALSGNTNPEGTRNTVEGSGDAYSPRGSHCDISRPSFVDNSVRNRGGGFTVAPGEGSIGGGDQAGSECGWCDLSEVHGEGEPAVGVMTELECSMYGFVGERTDPTRNDAEFSYAHPSLGEPYRPEDDNYYGFYGAGSDPSNAYTVHPAWSRAGGIPSAPEDQVVSPKGQLCATAKQEMADSLKYLRKYKKSSTSTGIESMLVCEYEQECNFINDIN
jgi:hypothetical protein